MHALMVRPLPAGCRLTAIFDSCHSATALDLPYVYSTEGKIKEPNLLAEAGQGLMGAAGSYLKGDLGGMVSGVFGVGKSLLGGNKNAMEKTRQTRTSPADVIMWSGCKDSQTSADTSEAGKATGAMSYVSGVARMRSTHPQAFIAAMTKNPQQSYVSLLRSIRDELRGRYDQKPQLSSSHRELPPPIAADSSYRHQHPVCLLSAPCTPSCGRRCNRYLPPLEAPCAGRAELFFVCAWPSLTAGMSR